jgi:Ca2+-binding RTX toxin-like protein
VKVLLFDGARQLAERAVSVGVSVPSISAVLAGGILIVTGDDQDNTITVNRDTAGTILVNSATVPVTGGIPNVATTTLIRIFGLGGNDVLLVDDNNGPMPPAHLDGGEGDDTLTGSNSDDELDGGPGNDTLDGRGGNDILRGGPGNDILIGGRGNDQIFGGEGDVLNGGPGQDVLDGGPGNNVLIQ